MNCCNVNSNAAAAASPPAQLATLRSLPLEQLELLGEALLDFSGPQDLVDWLAQQPKS